MRSLAMTAMSMSLVAWAPADANAGSDAEHGNEVRIARSGSQPPAKGPAEYFTGDVRVEGRFQADSPARVGGATVTFEPGARTAWHTHPLGETLIVTAGAGLVQHWGGQVQEMGRAMWSGSRLA